MPRGKVTKTPSGKRGKVKEDEFNYIRNAIFIARAKQIRKGGGFAKNSDWMRYRRIYEQKGDPLESLGIQDTTKDTVAKWSRPRINIIANTIDRQLPKTSFDNPDVNVRARGAEYDHIVPMLKNNMNYYLRYIIDFAGTFDRVNMFAHVNPFGVMRFGWSDKENFDEAMVECIDPRYFLVDPDLESWDLNLAKYVVETRFYTISELRNHKKFYNVMDVKPNLGYDIKDRDRNISGPMATSQYGLTDLQTISLMEYNEIEQRSKSDRKFHADRVAVDFFYDGPNKRVVAIPWGHNFEIGEWKFPENGMEGYPFEVLMYHPIPWDFYGLAGISRYEEMASELQKLETFLLGAAKQEVPKLLVDAAAIDSEDQALDKLTSPIPWEVVLLNMSGDRSIRDVVFPLTTNGLSAPMLAALDRVKRNINLITETFEQERSGTSGKGVKTATQAQIIQLHSEIVTIRRLTFRDRFLRKCINRIHKLMSKMIIEERNFPWIINEMPADRNIKPAFSAPFTGKMMAGEFDFEIDVSSGQKANRATDRKLLADFLAIVGSNQEAFPLDHESREYLLKEAVRRFDMNEQKIHLVQPQQPPVGPGMPGLPTAGGGEGGAAQAEVGTQAAPGGNILAGPGGA